MGFNVYYRSTEPVEPKRAAAIRAAAHDVNQARTWLCCEPVMFRDDQDDDGRLAGDSKIVFGSDPDDVAAASEDGLTDGSVQDLITALCELSRAHHVDWELSHDYDPGPIGFIRQGVADDGLMTVFDGLAGAISAVLGEYDSDVGPIRMMAPPADAQDDGDRDDGGDDDADDGEDDPPPILKLWTE